MVILGRIHYDAAHNNLKALVPLLINLLLWGCSADTPPTNEDFKVFFKPSTEKYVIFSPMEGVLMKGGVPLANTKIIRTLRWNGNEEGLVEEFITDDQGRFSLPIHEEELTLGMLAQFVAKADLEAITNNEIHELWYSSKLFPELYAETDGPIEELICHIDASETAVPMSPVAILTKCRWKNMPS